MVLPVDGNTFGANCREIAKLPECFFTRGFRRQSEFGEFLRAHVQMKFHLFVDITLHTLRAALEPERPAPRSAAAPGERPEFQNQALRGGGDVVRNARLAASTN